MPAKKENQGIEYLRINQDAIDYMKGVVDRRKREHEERRLKGPKPTKGTVYEEAIELFKEKEGG